MAFSLAGWAVLFGCGKTDPVEIEPIPIERTLSGQTPRVQHTVPPIRIGERAELVGFTFRGQGPAAPGTVYDATLSYRSLRDQEGQFTVLVGLLCDGKQVIEERVPVRTRREPVQRYLLRKGEPFWIVAKLQVPLGLPTRSVEILASLEVRNEQTGKPEAVPPPLRLGP